MALSLFLGAALAACTGTIGSPGADDDGLPGAPGGPGGQGGQSPVPGAGSATGVGGGTGVGAAPAVPNDSPQLPARIRRLTTAEYDASVRALFNVQEQYGSKFTPDARQTSFTRNDAQRVDPVLVSQLNDAAIKIADKLRPQIQNLAYCQNKTSEPDAEACARTFITTYAGKAYRRPATAREIDALVTVYRAGRDGAAYEDGIHLTIVALLMAPAFLYVTELGEAASGGATALTGYEAASAISYLITGGPPDDALMAAARESKLRTAEERRTHAARLFASDPGKTQVVRVVEEWLGVDRIVETAKDAMIYPDFSRLRDQMKREADAFVGEVVWKQNGTIQDLIGADWTIAEDDLARMYMNNQPLQRNGERLMLTSTRRRGIFGQAAFLSVYSHATETAPVLRGVALLRRVTCDEIPAPASLDIQVVAPIPDPSKTTRERFTAHVADEKCRACHRRIDPIGFSFEHLDAMGKERPMENNKPVDSNTTVTAGNDLDGTYRDSAELLTALSRSTAVRSCFARHLFRYSAARNDASVRGAEEAFVKTWEGLPADSQGRLKDVILAFVASDQFVARRVEK